MAIEYAYEILGHPSLLGDKERKLIFYFSEPDSGINEETGILLLIAGFGGNANSNVYKKMRNTFADKHNLITIQCDYFGYEFMQTPNNITLNLNKEDLKNIFQIQKYNIYIRIIICFQDLWKYLVSIKEI